MNIKIAVGAVTACMALLSPAMAAPETFSCVQQSRQMCEQGRGCKRLIDEAPNQWFFNIDTQKGQGTARRCSGDSCSPPFEMLVHGAGSTEVTAWEPLANEAFGFSRDRRQFTHSLTGARGNGGHVVSEFGYCARE